MKGLVGLAIEVEKPLPCVERILLSNCETWLSCDCIEEGISKYVEEIDFVCLERALMYASKGH